MRGQPRTTPRGRRGARHLERVGSAAPGIESLEKFDCRLAPAALSAGAGIVAGSEIRPFGKDAGIDFGGAGDLCGRGFDRPRHETLEMRRPAIAIRQAADDAELRRFVPGDRAFPDEFSDALVAREGPCVAGLFVRMQRSDPVARVKIGQDFDGVAHPYDQGAAARGKSGAQLDQAFAQESPLAARRIGQAPIFGFDDIKRQHASGAQGGGQRGMVFDAQVALEPDDLKHSGEKLGPLLEISRPRTPCPKCARSPICQRKPASFAGGPSFGARNGRRIGRR